MAVMLLGMTLPAQAAEGDAHLVVEISNKADQAGVWLADAGGGDYQSATKVGARPANLEDRMGLSMAAEEGRDVALMYWMGNNGDSYDLAMTSGYLEIWIYTSNPDFIKETSFCRVDIGSASWLGSDTFFWDLRDMAWQTGWNCFTLSLAKGASENGKPDLSALRWVRFSTTYAEPGDIFAMGGFQFVETKEKTSSFPTGLGPNRYEGKNILLLTDDLTGQDGWPRALQTMTGCIPIRTQTTIQTTEEARAVFQEEVVEKKPDIVIISLGMHDQSVDSKTGKNRVDTERFEENLTYFASSLPGTELVFVTPAAVCTAEGYYSPGAYDFSTDFQETYAEIIRRVAQACGASLADGYGDSLKRDLTRYTKVGDGIHLTTYGQVKLWTCISEAMSNASG